MAAREFLAKGREGRRASGDLESFDREPGPAPSIEPATHSMDLLVSMRVQAESHPRTRRLEGLRAIEDHPAGIRDDLTWLVERIGRDPARPWDAVRGRLDVERRPQIGDHQVVARVEPLPEVEGGDTCSPQMTEEATASGELENDIGDQRGGD